jgi:hypothetical protein
MNIAGNAQVVGESLSLSRVLRYRSLGIDVELQQERHLSVFGSFPDDDSISITIVVWERIPAIRKYLLLDLRPPVAVRWSL